MQSFAWVNLKGLKSQFDIKPMLNVNTAQSSRKSRHIIFTIVPVKNLFFCLIKYFKKSISDIKPIIKVKEKDRLEKVKRSILKSDAL